MMRIKMNESLDERMEKTIPKECIKGATLLSIDEAWHLSAKGDKDRVRKYNGRPSSWWLRSPWRSNFAQYVDTLGEISWYQNPRYERVFRKQGVCPALILDPGLADFKTGDRFSFGGYGFKVISPDYALCDEVIGECVFREDQKAENVNNYEASDVKKYVDSWFDRAYSEYKE